MRIPRLAALFAPFALALALTPAAARASWTCDDEASVREGRVLQSCGIGVGPTEDAARRDALKNAADELKNVCDLSSDCAPYELTVVPLRTECRSTAEGYRCTRGLRAMITPRVRPGFETETRAPADEPRGRDRFARDLDEMERLHAITRRISQSMQATFDEH